MRAGADLTNLKESSLNNVTAHGKLSANFDFTDETNHPTKFSMYSVLPEGMDLTDVTSIQDIFDNVILSTSGASLSREYLAQHCTPEMIKDYNGSGRTYIAFHFDFDDGDLPPSTTIYADFNLSLDMKAMTNSGYSGSLESYVCYDDTNTTISQSGLSKDDGSSVGGNIYQDINHNGSTDDLIATSQKSASFTYASSGQFAIKKSVKGSNDSTYKDKTTTEIGKDYSYALEVTNGSSVLQDIVIDEDLEALGHVKGIFKDIQFSSGYTGSYNKNQHQIKINEPVEPGKRLKIFIMMTLPNDKDYINETLKNQFTLKGNFVTNASTTPVTTDSNMTEIDITDRKGNISVKKVDEQTGETLLGAEFELYYADASGNKTGDAIASKTTNSKGYANFKNLEYNKDYVVVETKAPTGYKLNDTEKKVTLDQDLVEFTVKDKRIKGSIKVIKSNNLDNSVKVEGAKYQLSKVESDDSRTEIGTYTTDSKGEINVDNLEWGQYKLVEIESPQGYAKDEEEHSIEVDRNNVSKVINVNVKDVQDDVLVTLTKKVKTVKGSETNEILQGAKFKLYKVTDGTNYDLNNSRLIGEYFTNDQGQIKVNQLAYGTYVLSETIPPVGYSRCDDLVFNLTPSMNEVTLTAYDQRREGSLSLQKSDGKDHIVTGAKFTLYDENMTPISNEIEVDEDGKLVISHLEWGTYHLKETTAPQGYQLDENVYDFTIDATHLLSKLEVVNNQIPGKVCVYKIDSSSEDELANAKFNLCNNDGTVVATLVTDDSGKAEYDNLPWGSYYLEEIEAPRGYTLDKTKKRFVVNAETAGITQKITIKNTSSGGKILKITKKINKEDTHEEHGKLVFNYKVDYEYRSNGTWGKKYKITRNVPIQFNKGEDQKSVII